MKFSSFARPALAGLLFLGSASLAASDLDTWKRKAELSPDDPQIQFNLGVVAFQAKSLGVAAAALKRSTSLAPKDAEAWELYGTVLAAQKKDGPAAEALRGALKLDPKRAQAWQQLALLRSAGTDKEAWAEGAKAWEQAAALKPKDGRLRLNQGLLLAKLGQVDQAVATLEKAATLDGGQGAYKALCPLYNKLGKSQKAVEACAKAAAPGEGPESYYNLGYAQQRLQHADAARAALAQALKEDPEHAPSLYAMAFFDYAAGDAEKALAGFEAAAKARGGDYPEAEYNAAVTLSDLGRYEEAAGVYRSLLDRQPENADAKAGLAAAVEAGAASLLGEGRDDYERGDFDAAAKAWRRVLALDPSNAEASRLLKRTQSKADAQANAAAAAARKAAKDRVAERLKAQDAQVLAQGRKALDAGQLAEAVRLLDFYLRKNPKDAGARRDLYRARARSRQAVDDLLDRGDEALGTGDRAQAHGLALKALEQDPGNARAAQLLARTGQALAAPKTDKDAIRREYYAGVEQYLQGDLAGAVGTWKKVLGEDPNNLDAKRSLARAELELEALRKRGKG